jgi:hypothetical protein
MTVATHPSGPNYFALVEQILELLKEGGVSDRAAAWGVDILLSAVTGSAVEHGTLAANVDDDNELSEIAASIARASQSKTAYPRIVALGDELLSGSPAERFTWALDVLINGILATPRD